MPHVRKDKIILIVAVLTAVLSFLFIYKFLKDSSKAKLRYVIAKSAITNNQTISEKQLAYSLPSGVAQDDSDLFVQMADVVGKVALRDIPSGDYVLRSAVKEKELPKAVEGPKRYLTHETIPIPEGMEGLSVKASDIQNLPSDLSPGAFVDILANIPDYAGKKELVTIIHSAQIVSLEVEKLDDLSTIASVRFALLPRETKATLAGLAQGKLQIVLLSGKGKKPWTGPTVGEMEVIRANNQQKTILSGRLSDSAELAFEKAKQSQ